MAEKKKIAVKKKETTKAAAAPKKVAVKEKAAPKKKEEKAKKSAVPVKQEKKKAAVPKKGKPAEKPVIPATEETTVVATAETVPVVESPAAEEIIVTAEAMPTAEPAAEPVVEAIAETAPAPEPAPVPVETVEPLPAKGRPGKGKKKLPAPDAPAAVTAPVSTPAPAPPKPAPKPEVKHLVCLLGDEGLVKEYSDAFQQKGIAVIELKSLASLKNSAKKITVAIELTVLATDGKRKNLAALDETLPVASTILTNSITETVIAQAHGLAHRERVMGIAAFPTLLVNGLVELAPSLYTTKDASDLAQSLFESAKKETALVQDGIGMVMPRILCQSINEALFAVQNDLASPKEIDDAMTLAGGFPRGPIAWGEAIGFRTVLGVIDALYAEYHDETFKAAPLLRQLAVAGVFWQPPVPAAPVTE